MELTIPFRWVGSKTRMRRHILPILRRARFDKYVEPFGGAGGMFCGVRNADSVVEVYNDANKALCAFFRVLQDERLNDLIHLAAFTPFSRENWRSLFPVVSAYMNDEPIDELIAQNRLEQFDDETVVAFALFYCQQTGFGGKFGAGFGCTPKAKETGQSERINQKSQGYRIKISELPLYAKRFRNVRVSNQDFADVITENDDSDSLVYCDPPYSCGLSNVYKTGWTDDDERKLCRLAIESNASFVVSCYDTGNYKTLLEHGFKRIDATTICYVGFSNNPTVESVYYRLANDCSLFQFSGV